MRHSVAEEVVVHQAFTKVAPPRPHPHVSDEGLPRLAAGPAASLFDRMRDLASGRGSD